MFGCPSAESVIGVAPDCFVSVCFNYFGFDELVFEVVVIVLYFAIRQFSVYESAQLVVVIEDAVVFLNAVVGNGSSYVVAGLGFEGAQDIVGGVEGKGFIARAGDAA